jgi:hypothetical protein
MTPATVAIHARINIATRQHFAHLTLMRRSSRMSAWRSNSDFLGIQRLGAGDVKDVRRVSNEVRRVAKVKARVRAEVIKG